MPERIVYVVLSHDAPALLGRLVARLLDGDPACRVIVDHDAGGPPPPWPPGVHRDGRLRVTVLPREGGWGGWGLVSATLRALRTARRELDPDWVVLLSGHDYPVADPAAVGAWLVAGGADAYLEPGRVVDPTRRRADAYAHARYFYRWFALPRVPGGPWWRGRGLEVRLGLQRRFSLAQGLVFVWTLPRGAGTRVGVRRRRHPFGAALPCRFGSQWLALNRRALIRTLDRLDDEPGLERYFTRTVIPDEALFTTLLHADPGVSVHTGSPTAVRMAEAGGGAHPVTLGLADLEWLRAADRPFARKVELGASTPLMDALDGDSGR